MKFHHQILKCCIFKLLIVLSMSAIAQNHDEEMIEIMLMTPLDNVLAKSDNPGDFLQHYTELLRQRDIDFTPPKGFALADTIYLAPYRFIPNSKHISKYYTTNGVSSCIPPYYSYEGDAILLFPINIGSISSDYLIEDEFMAVYDDWNINCTDKVICIEDDEINLGCNIDRIYRYDYDFIPEQNPKFKHCIGIVTRKKAHPSFPIKLLLTDEGLKNKDKYIRVALDCVKYGETPNQFCEEEEISLKKIRKEGEFPLKRISNTGIIIERSPQPSNPLDIFKIKY